MRFITSFESLIHLKYEFKAALKDAVSGALITIFIAAGVGYADNPHGSQNQHKFSDVFLALKPGDGVIFSNQDNVTHHLVSVTPEYELEIGELQPGTNKALVLNHKGVVDLGCSMHPEMKMTIFVRAPQGSERVAHVVDVGAAYPTINLLSAL